LGPNGSAQPPSGGCARPTTPNRALKAEGLLGELAAELDKTHPGATASLREGMARDADHTAPGRGLGETEIVQQP